MEYIALQLFNGLVNGSFYALLSLGLAVIFGVLRVVNFAHGAIYMLGALVYAGHWPNPWPRTFGFHEVFHTLVLVAAAMQYGVIIALVLAVR